MDTNMMDLVKSIASLFDNENITVKTLKAFENGKPIVDIENGINKLNDAIENSKKTASKEGNPNYIKVPKSVLKPIGIAKYDCAETADKNFVFVPKVDIHGIDDSTAKGSEGSLGTKPSSSPLVDRLKKAIKVDAGSLEPQDLRVTPLEPSEAAKELEKAVPEETEFGPGERFTDITKNIYKDDFDETYMIHESVNGNRTTNETSISFDYTGEDGIITPGITDADLVWILLYRHRNDKKVFELLKSVLENL